LCKKYNQQSAGITLSHKYSQMADSRADLSLTMMKILAGVRSFPEEGDR
jgi:hypothetical protein